MSNTHRPAAVAVLPAPALAARPDDPPLLQRVRTLAEDLFEPGPGWSQEQRVALIAELETLKNVCAGAQATVTLDLHEQAARDREPSRARAVSGTPAGSGKESPPRSHWPGRSPPPAPVTSSTLP